MASIETAHAIVSFLTHRHLRKLVAASAHQVPKRVTTESVTAKENRVDGENNRAYPNSKRRLAGSRVCKPHCFPRVVQKNDNERQREIEKVSVYVL